MLYSEVEMSEEVRVALQREEEDKMRLYPPASANDMEFHILKFYCFSSVLVYNVLKVSTGDVCLQHPESEYGRCLFTAS